jgi:hypothetical protein
MWQSFCISTFMKPLKLLACLVTLQFTCGLTLKAADTHEFRLWTDANGRTITARLIETIGADAVKIERKDGQVFTVPLKTFSAGDQAYVQSLAELVAGLRPADDGLWAMLEAGGDQPASSYLNTSLDLVLETINRRFGFREVKNAAGETLQIRTEPADLAARIKISGDLPRMSMATFMKEIARTNDLVVATDRTGMVVLAAKPAAPGEAVDEFLGVKISQN